MGVLERLFPPRREAASLRNSAAEDLIAGAVSDCADDGYGADAVDRDTDHIAVELWRGAGDIVELVAVASAGGASRRERAA